MKIRQGSWVGGSVQLAFVALWAAGGIANATDTQFSSLGLLDRIALFGLAVSWIIISAVLLASAAWSLAGEVVLTSLNPALVIKARIGPILIENKSLPWTQIEGAEVREVRRRLKGKTLVSHAIAFRTREGAVVLPVRLSRQKADELLGPIIAMIKAGKVAHQP